MIDNRTCIVRPIQKEDIKLICHYWLSSTNEHLKIMGVDLGKKPNIIELKKAILSSIKASFEQKKAYYLIWLLNGKAVGYSNVNKIEFGEQATMHLHLFKAEKRRKGLGSEFVLKSLSFYFHDLNLKTIYCQPNSLNLAPVKTLAKTGFTFVKEYLTIPGPINFEQEVSLWKMSKRNFELKN